MDAWDIVIIAHEAVKQVGVMQPIAKGCIIGTEHGVAQFAVRLNFPHDQKYEWAVSSFFRSTRIFLCYTNKATNEKEE